MVVGTAEFGLHQFMDYKLLEITNLSKTFGETQVLKDVSLELLPGEVHFLAGENGAGKSTLMKIIAGIYKYDLGKVNLFGKKVAIVHQELSLIDNLTVADNLFLGKEKSNFSWVNTKKQKNETKNWLMRMNLNLKYSALVSDLSMPEKCLLEIAKGLRQNADILILDEPTSGLPEGEAQILFDYIDILRKAGKGIFYISHKMHEMLKVSDRITILRDGEKIKTIKRCEYNEDDFIYSMVGRKLGEHFPLKTELKREKIVLESPGFSLYRGEILGFSGLEGAGHTELFFKLFKNPIDSISEGIGFVSNDRKNEGLILTHSVEQNISLPLYKKCQQFTIVDELECKKIALKIKEKLHVKTSSMDKEVSLLSGGNQQKVVLAKWLVNNPRILILDEPTRGIDIGAKKEIYFLLRDFAQKGGAIIFYSSEMNELLGLCDRIITLYKGQIQNIYLDKEPNLQEKIMSDIIGAKYVSGYNKINQSWEQNSSTIVDENRPRTGFDIAPGNYI